VGWSRMLAAVLVVSLGYANLAAADRRLVITVSGVCPTRATVIAEIEGVLPDVTIVAAAPAPTPFVVVNDDGNSFRVETGDIVRQFVDSPTNCTERARKVAVVAVLALEPAMGGIGTPRASVSVIESVRPEPPTDLAMRLEAGGVVDRATGTDGDLVCVGIGMRLAIGRSDLSLVLGGEWVTPMLMIVRGARARVQRAPLDLALRGRLAGNAIAAALELGPRFTIQHSEGLDVMQSASAVRLEVGARVSVRLELWPSSSYGMYAQLQGEYVPRPTRFTLPDVGDVGEMPSLWAGAGLGLAIRTP
jgi:hypothetical protein